MNNKDINPDYYKAGPYSCADVVDALDLSRWMANAFKYLWRAGKKGTALKDLYKAMWYIEREIAVREAKPMVFGEAVSKLYDGRGSESSMSEALEVAAHPDACVELGDVRVLP